MSHEQVDNRMQPYVNLNMFFFLYACQQHEAYILGGTAAHQLGFN